MVAEANIPIGIVGAGIGGLTLAAALRDYSHPLVIFDRQAPQAVTYGALQLAPNAVQVIQELGLYEDLLAVGREVTDLFIYSAQQSRLLTRIRLKGAKNAPPYMVVLRTDLLRLLWQAAANNQYMTYHWNSTVSHYSLENSELFVHYCSSDEHQKMSLACLIGADGFYSPLRAQLYGTGPHDPMIDSGCIAFRTMMRVEEEGWADEQQLRLFLGEAYHIVVYPALGPEQKRNIVVVLRRKYIIDNIEEYLGRDMSCFPERIYQALRIKEPRLESIFRNSSLWTLRKLYERLPVSRYGVQAVTLLGDAAHPILPFLAQGATQSMEDAVCLARVLKKNDAKQLSLASLLWTQSLRDYESQRYRRVLMLQKASQLQGRIYHLTGKKAQIRDALMPYLMPLHQGAMRFIWR